MRTEQEVREELASLFFLDVHNERRVQEWLSLIDSRQFVAAERRLIAWREESNELQRAGALESREVDPPEESSIKATDSYLDLNLAAPGVGQVLVGYSEVGTLFIKSQLQSANILLEAREVVNVENKFASYFIGVTLSRGEERNVSRVSYDEIENLVAALQAMQRVNTSVSAFQNIELRWSASGDGKFSTVVYSAGDGNFMGVISSNGENVFFNSLATLNDLAHLFLKAKAYIEVKCQRVGEVDFKAESRRVAAVLAYQLALTQLVDETTNQYQKVLSTKFRQLTYRDEYGTLEYGNFAAEVDRFIGKILPTIPSEYRDFARQIVIAAVEKVVVSNDTDVATFDGIVDPLQYEQACCTAFLKSGWSANLTPRSGDQGADIVISHGDLVGVVQCKLYSQPVGNAAVQEVIAAREYYKASLAVVVSNAAYTTSAMQLASSANVVLLHHGDIEDLSHRLGMGTSNTTQRNP